MLVAPLLTPRAAGRRRQKRGTFLWCDTPRRAGAGLVPEHFVEAKVGGWMLLRCCVVRWWHQTADMGEQMKGSKDESTDVRLLAGRNRVELLGLTTCLAGTFVPRLMS